MNWWRGLPAPPAARPDTSSWSANWAWAAGASAACCWSSLPASPRAAHWPSSTASTGAFPSRRRGTRDNLSAGRLDLHRDGFGFVRPNARQASGTEDIFIPPNEINGAMQGDQVLVEVEPPKADGRRQGRIVRVLERRNPTVVGIFHYARSDRSLGPHTSFPSTSA